jgi:hypothetical protein
MDETGSHLVGFAPLTWEIVVVVNTVSAVTVVSGLYFDNQCNLLFQRY